MNESEFNDHSMFNFRKRGLITKTERNLKSVKTKG